jgi:transcriptional regulator with XRE-family HTH domain
VSSRDGPQHFDFVLVRLRLVCEYRDMFKSFGHFVRERRRQCGLTQRDVAQALGLKSIAFLSDIEAGNRKPAHYLLPALARVLKTDVEILKSHDIRSPLAEARSLLEAHPEYAVAFRRVVERSKELGPDEVLRRIDRRSRLHRKKQPPPENGSLPL